MTNRARFKRVKEIYNEVKYNYNLKELEEAHEEIKDLLSFVDSELLEKYKIAKYHYYNRGTRLKKVISNEEVRNIISFFNNLRHIFLLTRKDIKFIALHLLSKNRIDLKFEHHSMISYDEIYDIDLTEILKYLGDDITDGLKTRFFDGEHYLSEAEAIEKVKNLKYKIHLIKCLHFSERTRTINRAIK